MELTRPRVLVTRPEPGAAATAARLQEMGYEPVVLPLAETRPLAVETPDIAGASGVIVTSAAAIRHAPDDLIAALKTLPWFAVGEATGLVAREAGVPSVVWARGDAASLGDDLLARFGRQDRLIYLCGRVRRPELEARLAKAGVQVDAVEIYDTLDLEPASAQTALHGAPVEIVLVYSPRMASALVTFAARFADKGLDRARWIAISAQAARPLIEAGYRVEIAAGPSEAEIFTLIDRQ